jgi:hypothetical protein
VYGSYPLRVVQAVLARVLMTMMMIEMILWGRHHLRVLQLSYTRRLRVADHQQRLRAIYVALMRVLLQLLALVLFVFLLTGAREVVYDHIFPGLILLQIRHARSRPRELCDNFSIKLLACHY